MTPAFMLVASHVFAASNVGHLLRLLHSYPSRTVSTTLNWVRRSRRLLALCLYRQTTSVTGSLCMSSFETCVRVLCQSLITSCCFRSVPHILPSGGGANASQTCHVCIQKYLLFATMSMYKMIKSVLNRFTIQNVCIESFHSASCVPS